MFTFDFLLFAFFFFYIYAQFRCWRTVIDKLEGLKRKIRKISSRVKTWEIVKTYNYIFDKILRCKIVVLGARYSNLISFTTFYYAIRLKGY